MFNLDTAFFCLVLDTTEHCFERPVMQALVPVPAPVFIRTDVLGVTNSYRADTSDSTLLDDVSRQCVQKMVLSP